MPRQTIEDSHQMALIRWAESKAKTYPDVGLLMAYPIEGKRNIATAVRLKKKGARKGMLDLFLPINRIVLNGYCGLFLEMKSPDGVLSKEQKWWINKLSAQSYKIKVCKSWVDAALTICTYLGIPHDELDHAA